MLRKALRVGVKIGLLVGVALVLGRLLRARSAEADSGPRTAWTPLPDAGPARTDGSGAPVADRTTPAAASPEAAGRTVQDAAPGADAAYVEPGNDGTCPTSHPVKGKLSSRIFHLPGALYYERTKADRCYRDAEAAESDGLRSSKR